MISITNHFFYAHCSISWNNQSIHKKNGKENIAIFSYIFLVNLYVERCWFQTIWTFGKHFDEIMSKMIRKYGNIHEKKNLFLKWLKEKYCCHLFLILEKSVSSARRFDKKNLFFFLLQFFALSHFHASAK